MKLESIIQTYLKNLESIRKAHNRAQTISYYEDIITSDIIPNPRISRIDEIKAKGQKIVGTFCNFVPQELLYAADFIPIRLCAGTYETIHYGEEILPRDICPLIKSAIGFKILGASYFNLCDLIIVPTPCDGKMKLGEIIRNHWQNLEVWVLPLSHNIKHKELDLWLNEIKRLKNKLEQFGTKITRQKLHQAIKKLHNRDAVFRRLYQLRKHNPPPINGRDFLLVVQASFYDDIDRWIEKTNALCDELEKNKPEPRSTIRLLLTGAPIIWPNYKLINIIEETGAIIVADELCSGTQALYNPVEVDEWTEESMLRAIATKYLLPSTCPCFIESNDRIDRILNLIEEFRVDGVIYHSLRLCQLYDIESYRVRQVLKEKNIPMLNIHTDYSQEDVEQIKTRVEAFLEMITPHKNDKF